MKSAEHPAHTPDTTPKPGTTPEKLPVTPVPPTPGTPPPGNPERPGSVPDPAPSPGPINPMPQPQPGPPPIQG
jgi:pullulanase